MTATGHTISHNLDFFRNGHTARTGDYKGGRRASPGLWPAPA